LELGLTRAQSYRAALLLLHCVEDDLF